MKKIFLFITLFYFALLSKSQTMIAVANNVDSSWSVIQTNSPSNVYGNRMDWLWIKYTPNGGQTVIRTTNLRVDSLGDNDDASPTSVVWTDASGFFKRSTVATFISSAGLMSQTAADARYPQLSGSYSNPSWLTGLAWSKITSTPTTLAGYGITDAMSATLNSAQIFVGNSSNVATARTISGDWTISNTGVATLKNTGTAGTYGSATTIPVTTYDAQGRETSVVNTAITFPGSSSIEATATGTSYNFTGTYAKITLGTTSPTVTLPAAGTYLIVTNAKVDYSGLTTLSTGNVNLKLRRTNNTATDVLATQSFPLGIVTLLTSTAADVDVRQFLYTTATSGDVIELWGQVTNTLSVGSVQIAANGATLTAVRIY